MTRKEHNIYKKGINQGFISGFFIGGMAVLFIVVIGIFAVSI
jgi:hypothetical protein